jgi:hypothetical protein
MSFQTDAALILNTSYNAFEPRKYIGASCTVLYNPFGCWITDC